MMERLPRLEYVSLLRRYSDYSVLDSLNGTSASYEFLINV